MCDRRFLSRIAVVFPHQSYLGWGMDKTISYRQIYMCNTYTLVFYIGQGRHTGDLKKGGGYGTLVCCTLVIFLIFFWCCKHVKLVCQVWPIHGRDACSPTSLFFWVRLLIPGAKQPKQKRFPYQTHLSNVILFALPFCYCCCCCCRRCCRCRYTCNSKKRWTRKKKREKKKSVWRRIYYIVHSVIHTHIYTWISKK